MERKLTINCRLVLVDGNLDDVSKFLKSLLELSLINISRKVADKDGSLLNFIFLKVDTVCLVGFSGSRSDWRVHMSQRLHLEGIMIAESLK